MLTAIDSMIGHFTAIERRLRSFARTVFTAFVLILLTWILLPATLICKAACAQSPATNSEQVAGFLPSLNSLNLVRWNGLLPAASGRTVEVCFGLYENPFGGLAHWTETQAVSVGSDGRYSVLLGVNEAEGLPQKMFDTGEARWIEARLVGKTLKALTPGNLANQTVEEPRPVRSLLAVVPYAFRSIDAENLGGRAAADFVTRDDLEARVATEVQAVSRVRITSPVGGAQPGPGTTGYVPVWTAPSTLGNSLMSVSGMNVGVGTSTPATMFDVNGATTLRGIVSLLASAATVVSGINSPALQLGASTFSSVTKAPVSQTFAWQALSGGNNTANPIANMELLFGVGTMTPKSTGLSIASNGLITFAPGQAFPGINTGGGSSTLTEIEAGSGLTGGGSSGKVSLALSTPIPPALGGTGATTPAQALANLGAMSNGGGTMTGLLSGTSAIFSGNIAIGTALTFASTSAAQATQTNLTGSVTNYPEWFGAVGDGVHDDTTSIQAAFAALRTSRGTVHLASKTYYATGMIDIAANASGMQRNYRTLSGDGIGSTISCQPTTVQVACVRLMNGSQSVIKDVLIQSNKNVTYGIDITTSPNSTEDVRLENLFVTGGQYGVAIGPDTNNDVSHVTMVGVKVAAAVIAGMVVGNGVQGNVLDNFCYNCTIDNSGIGVLIRGGGLSWYGGGMDENAGADFMVTTPPDQPIVIDGVRSEGSSQFYANVTGNSAAIGSVSINNVSWFSGPSPATYTIQHSTAAPISITNSRFISAYNTVSFSTGNTAAHPTPIFMSNVGLTNATWASVLQALSTNIGVRLFSVNDYFVDNTFVQNPGSGLMYSSSNPVFNGAHFKVDSNGATAFGDTTIAPTAAGQGVSVRGFGAYSADMTELKDAGSYAKLNSSKPFTLSTTAGNLALKSAAQLYLDSGVGGFGVNIGTQVAGESVSLGTATSVVTILGSLSVPRIAGIGTATFAVGDAAGASPGSPACAASHICDSLSGTIGFTTGTATRAGIFLTVTGAVARGSQPNCIGQAYSLAAPNTALPVRLTYTGTTIIFNVGVAPTVLTAYELVYAGCGGN